MPRNSPGAGKPCPKCKKPMNRRRHGDSWSPPTNPRRKFYYSEWDTCGPCKHTQFYPEFIVQIEHRRHAS